MGASKTVGVVLLNKVQNSLLRKARNKLDNIIREEDDDAIEQLAWDVLGQKDLWLEKLRIQKRLDEIDDVLDKYTEWRDNRLKHARAAAEETLYPEVTKLRKIIETIEERTVFCLLTEKLNDTVEKILGEIGD
jgi:hypothetical protein